jgi:hypothetical protein
MLFWDFFFIYNAFRCKIYIAYWFKGPFPQGASLICETMYDDVTLCMMM